ncbi:MAG: transposase family protein [Clostridiaceae bacterium]
MIHEIIKSLSINLDCVNYRVKDNRFIIEIQSSLFKVKCPYCGTETSRVHSVYQREIQDIPIQYKQTILLVHTRKMFCDNSGCVHKTFAETFEFLEPYSKKTKRLIEKILTTSTKLSSVSASTLLKTNSVKVCKSSICDLLNKNASNCG